MSTKIYQAWRWPKALGVFAVTSKIEAAAKKEVGKRLRKLVRNAKIEDNRKARWEIASMLSSVTKISTVSLRIDPYDMNIVFMLREAPEHYLCMPTNGRDRFEFMKDIEGVEEFGYWDNTDRPDGMTQEEWDARGKLWDDYWKPEQPSLQFSALSILDPSIEITEMLAPDFFEGKKLPEDYWEDK